MDSKVVSGQVDPDPSISGEAAARTGPAGGLMRLAAIVERVPVTLRIALAFTYLFVLGSGWGQFKYRPTALLNVFALTLLCGAWWLCRRANPRRGWDASEWKESPLSGYEIAWWLLLLATTIANLDKWPYVGVGLWFAGASSLIYVIVHDTLSNGRIRLAQLTDGLLIAAFLPLVLGIVLSLVTRSRAAGMSEHPNLYGGMAAWIIPIAMARGLTVDATRRRWPYLAISLVAAAGLILSGSRGAMLGLMGASVVLVPRRYLLIGAFVAIPVAIAGISARWASVLSRLPIYEAAVEGVRDRPWFGHGLFLFRFQEGDLVHLHPHNVVLEVAFDLGLAGLLLAVVQALRFARVIVKEDAPERRGWIAALLGTTLHQLFDVTWMSPGMLAMLPVILAATTASISAPRRRAARAATWMYGTLAVLLLGSGFLVGEVDSDFFGMLPPAPSAKAIPEGRQAATPAGGPPAFASTVENQDSVAATICPGGCGSISLSSVK